MTAPPDLPGVTHEWVDAGGLRTHVALAGPEDAPPLLLVHGWPQHWWTWRKVIPLVAAGHRVIVPDLRGHGWTDAPRTGYAKEQLVDDLLAVLDALDVPKVHWAGHDWGGWTGMLAALRAPERVERLSTFAIPHLWGSRRNPRQLVILLYQGPISAPLAGPWVARRIVRPLLRGGFAGAKPSPAELDVYADVLEARPWVTVGMYRTFLTREMPPLLRGAYAGRRLEVPTTVTIGGKDLITKGTPLGPVAGQPQLVVDAIAEGGHFLPEECPEAVAERILAAPR
jgi:pimeloyl-ACP methyl ester carboxylesterase